MQDVLFYLLTALGIGAIIFVHELGHFLAARAVGVRVEAFSIGFGPRIFGFTRGPTEYKLCAIPLGGYVKMAGEDPTRPTTGQPDDFGSKNVWQRMLIISAGVIMNVAFALVVVPIAFSAGVMFDRPLVGGLTPGGPAFLAGLRHGDEVVAIEGRRINDFVDLRMESALSTGPLRFTVVRDGRTVELMVSPKHAADGFAAIGVEPVSLLRVASAAIQPEASRDENVQRLTERQRDAGLQVGDALVAVNGLPTRDAYLWDADVQRQPTADVTLTVRRGDARLEIRYRPWIPAKPRTEQRRIGVQGGVESGKVSALARAGPAETFGLRVDDVILSIDGVPFGSQPWTSLLGRGRDVRRTESLEPPPPLGEPLRMSVRRGSDTVELVGPCEGVSARRDLAASVELASSGRIASVHPGSPAEEAGLQPNDLIVSAGGEPISGIADLSKAVEAAGDNPIALVVERGEQRLDFSIRAQPLVDAFWLYGVESSVERGELRLPIGESLPAGLQYVVRTTVRVLQSFRGLLSGTLPRQSLAGPIGIFQASVSQFDYGFARALLFFAFVSVNLAVLNILPIPVLDGGSLMFLFYEKIAGRPPTERVVSVLQIVGLVIILGLVLLATWNDVSRFLRNIF